MHWPVFFLVPSILALDQLSKYLVSTFMVMGQSIPSVGFFRLTYIHNTGSAFGLMSGQNTILTVVAFLGIGLLLWLYRSYSNQGRLLRTSLALIMAGAIGNLIDRLNYGKVIDFFDVGPWPIFNIADSSIVVGGVTLAWIFFTNRELRNDLQGTTDEVSVVEKTGVADDESINH